MRPIATEVFSLTEQEEGKFVSLLNDDFFAVRGVRNPNPYLANMMLIARMQLVEQIQAIALEDLRKNVEKSGHKGFKQSIFTASFSLDEDMKLVFFTYFGERVPETLTYANALYHVLEVLTRLQSQLEDSENPQPLRLNS